MSNEDLLWLKSQHNENVAIAARTDLKNLTEKILNPYSIEKIKAKEETGKIALELKTNLTKLNNSPEIELKKQINTQSGDSLLTIDYTLTNKSTDNISFIFAVEFNFNITQGYDEKSCFYRKIGHFSSIWKRRIFYTFFKSFQVVF